MALALALGLTLLLGPALLRAQTVTTETKLTASDAQSRDWFGNSVAISGDTAIVGARWESAGGDRAGAAYIFQRDQGGAGQWGEVKKLTASDAEGGDWFGISVAISGDTATVGAYGDDAGGYATGAAYVFELDITSTAPAAAAGPGGVTDLSAIPVTGLALLVTSVESTPDGLVAVLLDNGCTVQSLAILEGGVWNVYVNGAPPQVNAAFPATLDAITPFFVRCG